MAGGILLSLSLFSYDWRDIGRLHAPPQLPPVNFVGPTGAWTGFVLFNVMGVSAYLVPLWCLGLGVYSLFFAKSQRRLRSVALWSMLLIWLTAAWLDMAASWFHGLNRHLNIGNAAGGFLIQSFNTSLVSVFGVWGTRIVLAAAVTATLAAFSGLRPLAAAIHATGLWLWQFLSPLGRTGKMVFQRIGASRQVPATLRSAGNDPRPQPRIARPKPVGSDEVPEGSSVTAAPPKPAPREPRPAPATARREKKPERHEPEDARSPIPSPSAVAAGGYQLPNVNLLDPLPPDGGHNLANDTEATARVIRETLAEFNIECQITNVEQGPVVTRYELLPAAGVRVERIGGLSNNLALSLKATSVRVQAPIPGKGVVGIEVPNDSATKVVLRQMVESKVWKTRKAQLPIVLGQDVGGTDLLADLTTMPHLLIAGATGSGKTVCMNTILAGLLMAKRPEELRLILVDPKIVEFSIYNKLPHLVIPVITDPKKVSIALRWAINEMEKRYKLFAKAGVRNIAGYNSRPIEQQTELFDGIPPAEDSHHRPERLPYVVIIVDELADLILTSQAEIENSIARLAQLSRAVGIHMIIATQRPSVNVITGTIKANFPGRIAFQVAQKVDSRTILDANGADKLLGRGDMLFLPPGTSKLVRAQGAMTSDDEIHRIVEWAKNQAEPSYEPGIHEKIQNARSDSSSGSGNGGGNGNGDEDDELVEASIQIIRETHRASTSSLQRRLRIGYTRAARIMDLLEERGMIGPPRGSDPREILIDLDGDIPQNSAETVHEEKEEEKEEEEEAP